MLLKIRSSRRRVFVVALRNDRRQQKRMKPGLAEKCRLADDLAAIVDRHRGADIAERARKRRVQVEHHAVPIQERRPVRFADDVAGAVDAHGEAVPATQRSEVTHRALIVDERVLRHAAVQPAVSCDRAGGVHGGRDADAVL